MVCDFHISITRFFEPDAEYVSAILIYLAFVSSTEFACKIIVITSNDTPLVRTLA
jgi:hypothetical protein